MKIAQFTAKDFAQRCGGVAGNGNGWIAKCPSHDDERPSLSIGEGKNGGVILHCFAGCSFEDICQAVGIDPADLMPKRQTKRTEIADTYDYVDENGKLLFQVCRMIPKDFRQRRPDQSAAGSWSWNTKGVRRVLFSLPAVRAAVEAGETVFLAEGEKDALALQKQGLAATCNPGGAGKWTQAYSATLRGADVVILPDKDAPGRDHAQKVAKALNGVARRVRICELPDKDASKVKDAVDFFDAGGTTKELLAAVEAAAEWTPPSHDDALQDRYGKPLFFGRGGNVTSLNERYFAASLCCDGKLLFEPASNRFYTYDPATGLWCFQTDAAMRDKLARHILEYGRQRDLELEQKLTDSRLKSIVNSMRGVAEARGVFGPGREYIHVGNGVIRETADNRIQLTEFDPSDYSRNRSPIAFTPDAECGAFINQYLRSVLYDDDIDLLQRWAGLAVARTNPVHRILLLQGAAASGKSSFARIIQKVVGEENCVQLRTAHLNDRFEIARFIGKTLLIAPDVQAGFLSQRGASTLKALTGQDPLSAEAKHANEVFNLTGGFNVLVTSNSKLRVRLEGDNLAWRRRLMIVNFENAPTCQKVANFAEKLIAAEAEGILRWCVAGYLRARQEVEALGDLRLTEAQQARVDSLLAESDSLQRFVDECLEVGEGDVTVHEITEGYCTFCKNQGWSPLPVQTVHRSLDDLLLSAFGVAKAHNVKRAGKAVRGWHGIELKAVETQVLYA